MVSKTQKRILVVDDEVELASLIKEELESENYHVGTAHDGLQALDFFD